MQMSGNIKVQNVKICCNFHGIGNSSVAKPFKTFQSIISVASCFSFAFLTNYLNQSDFIVSQPYSKKFALLMILANDYYYRTLWVWMVCYDS